MISLCAFENRPDCLVGAKLLILSVEKQCRDFTLYWGYDGENPEFDAWLKRHGPNVVKVKIPYITPLRLKQVKPLLFLELFDRGINDATWLDTDMIILRDLEPMLKNLDEETVLVAEDYHPFRPQVNLRSYYHMSQKIQLTRAVNSCVLRLTDRHRPLVKKWLECMNDPFYLEQWAKPPEQRLSGFGLDQTVLQVLLCCGNESWTPPPSLKYLRRGPDIVQEWGVRTYRLWDRFRNGLGLSRPWMIHSIGSEKPWTKPALIYSHRWASVYAAFAKQYADQVEEDMSWADPTYLGGRIARWLSFGVPHWVGWAHCLAAKMFYFYRRTYERFYHPSEQAMAREPYSRGTPIQEKR